MKLNYFSNQTFPKEGPGNKSAKISFGKSGVINLNKVACDLIGIKPADKITLAQDEENPENWYLFIDQDNGFEVRAGYDKHGVLFNHSKLADSFRDCFGLDDATVSFKLAQEPTTMQGSKTKYWGILVNVPAAETAE